LFVEVYIFILIYVLQKMSKPVDNITTMGLLQNATNNKTSPGATLLFSQTEYTIQAAFLLLIIVLIVLGNSLLLFILYHDKNMRTPMYILIASLAVSDFGVGVSTAPLTLVTVFSDGQWVLGDSACIFQAMANSTFFIATMLTLTAMTMEKFFSIVRPLSRFVTPKRTKRFVIVAWVLTLLFSTLPLVGFGRYGINSTTQSCGLAFPNTASERIYLMLTLFLGFMLPLGVMIVANIIIFIAIRKHSARLQRHVQGRRAKAGISASQKHFTVTVLIILAVFILSWTPFLVLAVTAENRNSAQEMPRFLGILAYWCGYAASAWNPVIYVTRNRRFREGIRFIRDKILCREPVPSNRTTSVSNSYGNDKRISRHVSQSPNCA